MESRQLDTGLFRTDAANGLVVLTEAMDSVRSVAVGCWVRSASAHEPRAELGVSHLLEHMVFKGTERRSAREIALALESRGGALDAYTGRDHTTYQARVLDADLPVAVDVLTDVVRRPALRDSDLSLERKVVLEEIAAVLDSPEELAFDLHAQTLWPDHAYGFPILGTRDTVSGLTADDLRGLHRRAYLPGQMVFAAAGRLTHGQFLDHLRLAGWFDLESGPEPQPLARPPEGWRGERRVEREGEQVHLVFGSPTVRYGDRRRYAVALVTTALGGGMSSRLFQRVREELGLAYSVYAFHAFYSAAGVAGVYVGTRPSTAQQARDVVLEELRRLATDGLDAAEIGTAKQQVRGQLVLALESPLARMYRVATVALYGEDYRPLDALLAEIEAITPEELGAVASEFFAPERQALVMLGPVGRP